jgi:hypothetical protein
LAALCIALILTGNTISVKNPTNEGAQSLVMVGVQAQTVLTILRIVAAVISSQLENRFLTDASFTVILRRVGAIKKHARKGLGDSAAEEEGRFAEHHFFGDGAMWGRELTEIDTTHPPEPALDADPLPLPVGVSMFGSGGDLLDPTSDVDLFFERPSFQMDDPFGDLLQPAHHLRDDVVVAEDAILSMPVAVPLHQQQHALRGRSSTTGPLASSMPDSQGSAQRKVRPKGTDPKSRSILLQIGDEEDDLDFEDLFSDFATPAGLQPTSRAPLPAAQVAPDVLLQSTEVVDPNPLGVSTATSKSYASGNHLHGDAAFSTSTLSISGDDPFNTAPAPVATAARGPPTDLDPFLDLLLPPPLPLPAPVLPLSDRPYGLEPELAALL